MQFFGEKIEVLLKTKSTEKIENRKNSQNPKFFGYGLNPNQ